MKQHKNTLAELGCEELPAFQQFSLIELWRDSLATQLKNHRLSYGSITGYCGPRRLSLLIKNLAAQSEGEKIIKEGPAKQIAYDKEGSPTPACIGFARSCGVKPAELVIRKTAKGERLCYERQLEGKRATDLLPQLLSETLQPLCKGMRWPQSPTPFIRPVRWLVLMVDNEKLSWQMFGLRSDNQTYGHRLLSARPVRIDNAADYEKILRQNRVIADQQKRIEIIRAQAAKIALRMGARLQTTPQLEQEISGLVEDPTAYIGQFNEKFLQLPREILHSVICGTQKYLMLTDKKGSPLPSFLFIANIASKKPKQLISGNEAVITPRLEDAAFFYEQDKKAGLRFEPLKQVAFFTGLGDMQQKSIRCVNLATQVGKELGLNKEPLARAAKFCKCDLVTLMVQEFPHLQGIMGSYYLLAAKSKATHEDRTCAAIIGQHYLPQRATDPLPELLEGCVLSLVDKLDGLVGLFATNHKPSGAGDPYGLRRSALAAGRILIEKSLDLDIAELLQFCMQNYISQKFLDVGPERQEAIITEVLDFIKERIFAYASEKGLNLETLTAAFAANERRGRIYRLWLRAQALNKMTSANLSRLIGLNKRLRNILGTAEDSNARFNRDYIKEKEEQALYETYQRIAKQADKHSNQLDYAAYSHLLVELAEPLAVFFDRVMVMVEEPAIRANRLALLTKIHGLFLQLGDLSIISLRD